MYRTATEFLLNPVSVFFGKTQNISDWLRRYKPTWSALKTPLPENVKLLNLKHNPFSKDGLFILRLHHLYGVGEDPVMSVPVTIDLDNLFANHKIIELHERGLNALPERSRLTWNINNNSTNFGISNNTNNSHNNQHKTNANIKNENDTTINEKRTDSNPQAHIVTLNPMDIKTYLIRLVPTTSNSVSHVNN